VGNLCYRPGGEEALKAKPYCIYYGEPSSPLKHPRASVEKLLLCAEKSMPLVYSPAPIAGSTAPMTIAGHVVQGLAECFCGLVLHQLTAPGAPFLMGMGPAVLDMATSQCSYNAPEYLMSYAAIVEMSHFYRLPNWGYAGTSDSQIPDEQAVFEGGLEVFLAAALGSNLNHDVGYLDFGQTGSLEMILIMSEIIEQVRRFMKGAPVDDENIALSVVREAAAGMDFLGHPHTHRHFRATQWRPRLISRKGRGQWEQEGSLTLLERAHVRLMEILAHHEPPPLASDKIEQIADVMARNRKGD
jgi:trimethylamine--corrinoid protein Co-methyltransferase